MKRDILIALGASVVTAAVMSVAGLAAEDYNSSRSNISRKIPGFEEVVYGFDMRLSVDGADAALDQSQMDAIMDEVCASAKQDIAKQSAPAAPGAAR